MKARCRSHRLGAGGGCFHDGASLSRGASPAISVSFSATQPSSCERDGRGGALSPAPKCRPPPARSARAPFAPSYLRSGRLRPVAAAEPRPCRVTVPSAPIPAGALQRQSWQPRSRPPFRPPSRRLIPSSLGGGGRSLSVNGFRGGGRGGQTARSSPPHSPQPAHSEAGGNSGCVGGGRSCAAKRPPPRLERLPSASRRGSAGRRGFKPGSRRRRGRMEASGLRAQPRPPCELPPPPRITPGGVLAWRAVGNRKARVTGAIQRGRGAGNQASPIAGPSQRQLWGRRNSTGSN